MEVLWLKSFGLSHKDIAKYANVCEDTVTNYLREYKEEGIEGLKERHFYQPQSDLENYHSTLEAYFREHPPHTAKQAAQKIEELTGIKRSPQQVRTYLKKLGMKCIKVGQIPAKADIAKQEKFLHEELQPKLEEARSGKRTVFFVDASHFVLSAFLGFVWCFVRIFIKTPSGRQRFNVLGALNAITHEVITITNTTYINAQSVCELLKKLAQNTVNKPITLVMDNARYQRCKLVTEYAKSLSIDLLFLPPYSPNLNLIERLWRFVKKKLCILSIMKISPLSNKPSHLHLTKHRQPINLSLIHFSLWSFNPLKKSNSLKIILKLLTWLKSINLLSQ